LPGDLDEIEVGVGRHLQRNIRVEDPYLRTIRTHHPHLRDPDTVIDPQLDSDANLLDLKDLPSTTDPARSLLTGLLTARKNR
jgi:hypothetical protein